MGRQAQSIWGLPLSEQTADLKKNPVPQQNRAVGPTGEAHLTGSNLTPFSLTTTQSPLSADFSSPALRLFWSIVFTYRGQPLASPMVSRPRYTQWHCTK